MAVPLPSAIRPPSACPLPSERRTAAPGTALRVVRPGRVGYADALAMQRAAVAELRSGTGPETLFLLEHPPVVTMGRRATQDHLLVTPAELAARGAELVETDRGGDITFHGPGQAVGYPILDLRRRGLGAHTYLRFLEEILLGVLAGYGIRGFRDPEHTGVWTDEGKIAAMGIRVSGGVSLHGFALNVATDLDWFGTIVPCGIRGRAVASMDRVLGRPVPMDGVMDRIAEAFVATSPTGAADAAPEESSR